jgi:Holliday junction resolvase RusA-like endonuclease
MNVENPNKQPFITLALNIPPHPKGRPRFDRRGFAYTDPKTRKYESDLKSLLRQFWRPRDTLNGAIELRLRFYLAPVKSSKRLFPTVKPDIDNFSKAVMDAMNGIVWNDDSQVITLTAEKWYVTDKSSPQIKIMIREIDACIQIE